MMAAPLRSGLDLARQNIPKLPGFHFGAQAQIRFAQGLLGVVQGDGHGGAGTAGGEP